MNKTKRKIRNFLWGIVEYCYREPKRFIQNVWFFRKELSGWWSSDQEPTLALLRRALEGMEETQRTSMYFRSINADNKAKNIRTCVLLLNRIIDDKYDIDKFEYNVISTPVPDMPQFNEVHIEVTKKKDLPGKAMANKLDLKKQDTDLLFKIISKHIHGWWT